MRAPFPLFGRFAAFRTPGNARNAAWLILEKGFRWLVALTVGVWLARALGPAQFGALASALSLVLLWGSAASFGIDNVVVRELVRTPSARGELLGTAFALRLLGGALAGLGAALTGWLLRADLAATLTAIAAVNLAVGAGEVFDLWFQAEVRAHRAVVARTLAFAVISAARVVLLLNHASPTAFAWAFAAEAALASVALAFAYRAEPARPALLAPTFARARALLRESWPNIVSGLAMMAYMKLDRVLLGELADDRAVGLYGAACTLTEAWYFLPVVLASSATPALTRLRATDPAAYLIRLAQLARLLAALGWALGLALTLAAPFLAGGLFGAAYRDATPILAILAWGLLFAFVGVAASPWYLNEGLLRPAMWRHLLGAALNLLLNLLFIPRWGAPGAACATVIAFASAHVFANALDPRTRVIFRLQLRALLLLPPRPRPPHENRRPPHW